MAADPRHRELMTATLDQMSHMIAGGQRTTLPKLKDPDAELTAEDFGEDIPQFPGSMGSEAVGDTEVAGHPNAQNTSGTLSWGGHSNGYIPANALVPAANSNRLLEAQAAHAWGLMVKDAAAQGVALSITDGYRTFDSQVNLRATKGDRVATATPGYSVHGWGKAIDVASGGAGREWVQKYGAQYGWIWPTWAQRTGTKQYEPWHFEYRP